MEARVLMPDYSILLGREDIGSARVDGDALPDLLPFPDTAQATFSEWAVLEGLQILHE
jgi:hypothetical protein